MKTYHWYESLRSRLLAEIFAEDSPTPEALMVSLPVMAEVAGIKEENDPTINIRTAKRDLVAFENKVSPSNGLPLTPLNASIIGRTAKYHSKNGKSVFAPFPSKRPVAEHVIGMAHLHYR